MYALVYFKNSDSTDVLRKSAVEESKSEKGVVYVTYGKRRYKGVILKESKVCGGIIMKPKRSKQLTDKSKEAKSKKTSTNKAHKEALRDLDLSLRGRKSIFPKEPEGSANLDKSPSSPSNRELLNIEAMDEDVRDCSAIGGDASVPVDQKYGDECGDDEVSENEDCIKVEKYKAVVMRAVFDLQAVVKILQSIEEKNKSKRAAIVLKNLPALKKKQGSSELLPNSGVYIQELDRADALRFVKRPTEMIRRLFTFLVGAENLGEMSPKGNGPRIGVPEKIERAVYSEFSGNKKNSDQIIDTFVDYLPRSQCTGYVNGKVETEVDYDTFTKVLSSQCVTLRDPSPNLIHRGDRLTSSPAKKVGATPGSPDGYTDNSKVSEKFLRDMFPTARLCRANNCIGVILTGASNALSRENVDLWTISAEKYLPRS
ncbi:hypothetical protein QAD02_003419 [Eretmocerus hayati]|uniref:Uncharacterized protein n=1 Tax=Eretmocerus hayati TaxID=131215 RepID=A0ACC2NLM3_9HYME|nr:hypothetical protein QAD02_003419 [Eretmocerus hayati]